MKKPILVGRTKTTEEFVSDVCIMCERDIEILKRIRDNVSPEIGYRSLCFHCFLEIKGITIKDPFIKE